MKIFIFLFVFSFTFISINAQLDSIKPIVKTLCSPAFEGRGYVNGGMQKAAKYIAQQFKNMNAMPMYADQYLMSFDVTANVIENETKVFFDNKDLIAGKDYIIDPKSPSIKGLFRANPTSFSPKSPLVYLKNNSYTQVFFDTAHHLLMTEADEIKPEVVRIKLRSDLWQEALDAKRIKIDFKNETKNHTVSNVCAKILGRSDTAIFITAHYDHLGKMGMAMFPGASDNASGTAMMLSLAKYFSHNPHKYTLYFVAFAAEETGLKGSEYFIKLLPLAKEKIKMVINLDIMGCAEGGITVVNTEKHVDFLNQLRKINIQNELNLPEIKQRGNTKNSDHYFFTTLNIPAVFIYSNGGQGYYHDVDDTANNLLYTNIDKVFDLLKIWIAGKY